MATFNFQKFKQIRNFLFFFNTTTMRKSQVASSTRTMNLVANNLSKSCFMTACSSNSFNTVLDVMKVYYYQVQFNVVQSEVEYLLIPIHPRKDIFILFQQLFCYICYKRVKIGVQLHHLQFIMNTQIKRENLDLF